MNLIPPLTSLWPQTTDAIARPLFTRLYDECARCTQHMGLLGGGFKQDHVCRDPGARRADKWKPWLF